ncbi:MAG: sulfotransferase [Gammaproteobacteria bacterium]|nr:MAG: sulfotransferase [Gammaproteobacteria bacterium]
MSTPAPHVVPLFATPFGVVSLPEAQTLNPALAALFAERATAQWRDPLAPCLSVYFLHLDHRMSYGLDLMDTGHFYRQYRRLMAHWKRLFGAGIVDFDYDALVRAPEATASALFGSLGLDWDPRFLEFPRSGRAIKTASVWQAREPLYRHSSGRARHYARQLAPLREYLADLLPAAGADR